MNRISNPLNDEYPRSGSYDVRSLRDKLKRSDERLVELEKIARKIARKDLLYILDSWLVNNPLGEK